MASTPVSSIASSATNVADVLASLGNDELAAEVGSWSAELQAKVVAAVSALSTSTSASASTVVRRRKSNKLDTASSSTAASWLAPAVAPADLTAELAAIQEGDRSPAATTVADEEVINFGAMQAPLGSPPVVVVDFSGATGQDLGGPGDGSADTGGLGGATGGHGGAVGTTSAPTATTSSATAFLAAMAARHRRLLPRHLRPPRRRPASWRPTAVMGAQQRRRLHPQRRSRSRRRCRRTQQRSRSQRLRHRRFVSLVALSAGRGPHGEAAACGVAPARPRAARTGRRLFRKVGDRRGAEEQSDRAPAPDRRGDVRRGAGNRQLGQSRRWRRNRQLPVARGGQGQDGTPA